jgi:hypothetical protein
MAVPAKLVFGLPRIFLPNAGQGGVRTHILAEPFVIMDEMTRKKEETTPFWPALLIFVPEIRPMVQYPLIWPNAALFWHRLTNWGVNPRKHVEERT